MLSRREFLQVIPALAASLKNLALSDNILEPSIVQATTGFPITFDLQFPEAATVATEETRWYKIHMPIISSNAAIQASDRPFISERTNNSFRLEQFTTWEE